MELAPRQSLGLPHLPEEAIEEILSRLPVKTLLRFRCVCRSWNSLISHPRFVKLHHLRSSKNVEIVLTLQRLAEGQEFHDFFAVRCSIRSLLNFPPPVLSEVGSFPLAGDYQVIGCSNGLVCLFGPKWDTDSDSYTDSESDSEWEGYREGSWFRFWNPATRVSSGRTPAILGGDDNYFGFGYDNTSDTYKVVAVIMNPQATEDSKKMKVKVFTMGDNRWRDIANFPALPVEGRSENENYGVYMSGTLNWLGMRDFSLGYQWALATVDRLVIVSLDLGRETSRLLLMPELDDVPQVKPFLGVLNGCLCLSLDYKGTHFIVWQMKEFGVEESWTRLMNVSYQHLQVRCIPTTPKDFPVVPMCMSEDGHVIALLYTGDSAVILYDTRDNGIQFARTPNNDIWTYPLEYFQSLVLPL